MKNSPYLLKSTKRCTVKSADEKVRRTQSDADKKDPEKLA